MSNIIRLPRKVRPLTKTYQPSAPYVVERVDDDQGEIRYEVIDERPESHRIVCSTLLEDGYAKHDAEQIVRGLNMLVQSGKEKLPAVKEKD